MQKGPKPAELTLSEEEHKRLEALVPRHTTPHQSLDWARNCRGTDAARDCPAHFSTTRLAPLKKGGLQPHLIRYWLTPPADPQREQTIVATCQVYQQAPQLAKQGERTMSTDELTGVQALERKHPGLPLAPGKVERREFEYLRHGTRAFIVSRDVVTGEIVAPFAGPRRTEEDFLTHVRAVIATAPETS